MTKKNETPLTKYQKAIIGTLSLPPLLSLPVWMFLLVMTGIPWVSSYGFLTTHWFVALLLYPILMIIGMGKVVSAYAKEDYRRCLTALRLPYIGILLIVAAPFAW